MQRALRRSWVRYPLPSGDDALGERDDSGLPRFAGCVDGLWCVPVREGVEVTVQVQAAAGAEANLTASGAGQPHRRHQHNRMRVSHERR